MAQAVAGLEITPHYVLIDGNRCPPGLIQPAEAVVKGDANSASIAAASILAKVSRDRYMLELDKQYPQYQLAKHKGYPTKLHYELIAQYGIQPFYRRSFLKRAGPTGMTDVGLQGEAVAAKYYQQRGRRCLTTTTARVWGSWTLFCIRKTPSSLPRSRPAPARCWTAPPPRWTPGSRTA